MSSRGTAVLAALVYLALALFQLRDLWPDPADRLMFPARTATRWERIMQTDQQLTVATIVHGARSFAALSPARLVEGPQCWPVARAITLGEHMYGNALVGVVPWLVTRDPLLTYHAVLVLVWVAAALGMYALVVAWTGSAGAGFVAGLLFGFHPTRITDVPHPYVHGDQWLPLALLFAWRLFTRGRWSDALGLAVFLVLQTMESIYPLIACLLVGGIYGAYLVVRHRDRLVPLLPKIAVVAVITAAGAAAVLGPYLVTREVWGTLGGRSPLMHGFADFGRQGQAYPGTLLLVLAFVGIADRLRRGARRAPDDPRWALVAGGVLVLWASTWGFAVPGTAIVVPSLLHLIGLVAPGMDAIRGGGAIRCGVYAVLAVLAGYGVRALAAPLGVRGWAAIAVLALVGTAEIFWAPFARWSFGGVADLTAFRARPPAQVRALYEQMPPGPVLDVPYNLEFGQFILMAEHVLAGAYHGQPVVACYNSFKLPLQEEIAGLAKRAPTDPRAREALRALGMRTIVSHRFQVGQRRFGAPFAQPPPAGVTEVGSYGPIQILRLEGDGPVNASFATLAPDTPGAPTAPPVRTVVHVPLAAVKTAMRNDGAVTYRHPDPVQPSRVVARWRDASGAEVAAVEQRLLLPLALAAGDRWVGTVELQVPGIAPGDYDVELVRAADPSHVLTRVSVRLEPAVGPA